MRWPWDRRRTLSGAAVVCVPAVLATLAVVNPGFPLAQVDLNDSAVWLTSTSTRQLGRYNAPVEELNAGLVATGGEFDVLQQAGDVLLVEPGTVSVVDPATVTTSAQVAVPAGAQVAMQDGTVVVADGEGRVWARTLVDLPALQTSVDPPDATVDGALVVVGTGGDAFAVAAGTGEITRLSPSEGGETGATAAGALDGPVEHVTAVGDQVVGLDGDTVRTPGGSSRVGLTNPVLQQAGGSSSSVLVAGITGLVEVALSTGRVTAEHHAGGAGTPAAPVRVAGCGHAAWSTTADNYLLTCDGEDPQLLDLEGVTTADNLVFRVNRDVVALNETVEGRLWLPLEDTRLRKPDWADVLPEERDEDESEQAEGERTMHQLVAECTATSVAPQAVDDQFGVRAGRTTILPVIDNDTSSDCGILVVSDVDDIDEGVGTLQEVYDGRALQLAVAPDATGEITFRYSVSDGRGTSSPSTAEVTVTIRDQDANEPPEQDRTGTITLEQGATATYPVLSDFTDPEGDELTLVGATAEKGTARFRQDGTLTYVADGGDLGATTVHVQVSDGVSTTEGVVQVDVRAAGTLDLQLDPVHARTYVDQKVRLDTLAAVRTQGAERPRLAGVEEVAGTTVSADLDDGTVDFTAAQPGTYYVAFTVTAAPQQATGLARVDVVERPAEVAAPVAVLDRAWVPGGGDVTVAPLENDSDPGGGVLVVQSVTAPDELLVTVHDHELVQISAVGALTGPVTVEYVVSNGAAAATGQITVAPSPATTTSQPPVVPNLVAQVRTGGVVTIPALEDAYDPDGDELTLATELAEPLAEGEGLMFVSGRYLRYQAPDEPTTVRATFVVRDSTGNETAATVTVQVHESDPATKSPSRPQDLVSRVYSGDTVRVGVPLVGIDDDGDGVTLLGVDTAGSKGRVTRVGADWLEYEALPGETGTDELTYAVEDWTGQRSVATIRVGIAIRPQDANRVVARDDDVRIRPSTQVEVRVLDNDVDLSGGDLSVAEELEVPDGLTAQVVGARVQVQAEQAGEYALGYTATNELGARAGAVLRVAVDPEAEVLAPVAKDVVVSPVDSIGRTSVDVDVLAVAQNPSGPLSDLAVSVPASARDVAEVLDGGTVRVTLADSAQTVPYRLTNTTDDTGVAATYAFITVPALGFFPPTARPGAPELRVASGQTLTISLDEQVQVAPGRTARVADASAVSATRSDGSELVVDATTVRFTSADGYVGPASVTVPVTDATGPEDETARTSTITLPITVYTEDDYPPTFSPSRVEVAPGEAATVVDLRAFTQGVEGADGAQDYTYRLTSDPPAGFSASLNGSRLSVSTAADTPKGTRATLDLSLGYGRSGRMDVQVEVRTIASTRRLASVPDRTVNDGVQGRESVVDVLSGAYNPFPDESLRVVAATVQTAGAGAAGVSGSRVVVRPATDLVGQMVVQVRVRDATNDAAREVAATITLRVRGKPETPRAPRVGEVRDSTVVLSWDAPDARGEPITGYRVTVGPGGQQRACASTTCTIDGLTNNQEYTFTVAAQNAVGWSDPSSSSAQARPDAVPDAPGTPTLTGGDGQATATWPAARTTGSPVTSYTVMISPSPPRGSATQTVSGTSATFHGLTNGTAYTVQVRAQNRAPQPSAWSGSSAAAVPAGVPTAPQVRATRVDTPLGGQINVTWSVASANGDPVSGYRLRITGGGTDRTEDLGGGTTSYAFTEAANGQTYTFRVEARNGVGWSSAGSTQTSTYGSPGAPVITAATASGTGDGAAAGGGWVDLSWTLADTGGAAIAAYEYSVDGGGWQHAGAGTSARVGGLTGGQAVSIRVRARNAGGYEGPASEAVSATPVTRPGNQVSGLSARLGSATGSTPATVTFSWGSVGPDGGSAITGYTIVVDCGSGCTATSRATGTTAALQLSAVPASGQVQVRLSASNAVGTGSWTGWTSVPIPGWRSLSGNDGSADNASAASSATSRTSAAPARGMDPR